MAQITKEMILAVHKDLIRTGGQVHGVLCEGTLDYIVEEINFVPLCQGSKSFVYVKVSSSFRWQQKKIVRFGCNNPQNEWPFHGAKRRG